MDISSGVTLRKNKTGQAPEGHDALQLSNVFNLLQSMEKRLSERLSAIESTSWIVCCWSSLEHAHNTISDLISDLSGIKTELAEVRAEKRKSDIISELGSEEFNLLFRGLPTVSSDETPEQSEDVVRSFLTTSLRFPESDLPRFHLPMSIVCQSILQHFSQVVQVILSLQQ